MFLGREQKYKFLFEEGDKGVATVAETLHRLKGVDITLEEECSNQSMLRRKNLSNPIDISAKTLLRHVKDVEANAEKSYALCTQKPHCIRISMANSAVGLIGKRTWSG